MRCLVRMEWEPSTLASHIKRAHPSVHSELMVAGASSRESREKRKDAVMITGEGLCLCPVQPVFCFHVQVRTAATPALPWIFSYRTDNLPNDLHRSKFCKCSSADRDICTLLIPFGRFMEIYGFIIFIDRLYKKDTPWLEPLNCRKLPVVARRFMTSSPTGDGAA